MKKKIFSVIISFIILFVFFPLLKIFNIQNENEKVNNIYLELVSSHYFDHSKESINCRKSAKFIVSTTLCVHDLKKDQFVSKAIWINGIYEPKLIEIFTKYIQHRKDLIVFDIGAQIGQFTLFAAKIGRKVVSIEPFFQSILRIDKAARIEGIRDRIILLKNGISNTRAHKILSYDPINIGGQSLFESESAKGQVSLDDNYMIKTVLLDDLIEILPKADNGQDFKNGVIKIDIEGYEPFAFERAKLFFKKIKIELIIMEWNIISKNKLLYFEKIENMISFFDSQGLVALENGKRILNNSLWKTWPNKFYWIDKKMI